MPAPLWRKTVTSSNELANKFMSTNRELQGLVDGLSEEQWQSVCADTGWSVGVTIHHVTESLSTLTGLVQAMASGAKVPEITAADLDAGNAEHAMRSANVTKRETAELLRTNLAAGETAIRGLGEAELKTTTVLPFGEMTAEQVIEGIMIGHTGMHIGGLRDAIR